MALITYLTRIQFDFGALKLLEAELQLLGMRRPLIVTDKGVIAAGLWARVKEQLPGNMPIAIYDGTPENPTEAAMRDALKIYKDEGCDGIIAIGGGSPMDLAKAVGLMATHPGNSLQAYSFVEGGAPQDHRGGGADRRHSDDLGHRQRGEPRRRHHHGFRPQARHRQPAPDSQAGADRSRADPEPAAASHGRHRHGRLHPQYRMLPVQRLQPAGRFGSRSMGWRRPGSTSSARRGTARTARRATTWRWPPWKAPWCSRRAWARCMRSAIRRAG